MQEIANAISAIQKESMKLRVENAGLKQQIIEMQLIIDKANERLKTVHIPNVSGSLFEPTDEQIDDASYELVKEYNAEYCMDDDMISISQAKLIYLGMIKQLKKIIGENVR